jgi:hypothetical protein
MNEMRYNEVSQALTPHIEVIRATWRWSRKQFRASTISELLTKGAKILWP